MTRRSSTGHSSCGGLLPPDRRLILVTGDVSMEFRAESQALEVRHVSRPGPDDE